MNVTTNPERMIDLSSDTSTRPSAAMRQFMAEAPVGDEQLREDPTVNLLQDMAAELTGKEAALFLPSGTMCNAIAFSLNASRGEAVILDRNAHPNISEAGGPAWLAGVMMRPVDTKRGIFGPEDISHLITEAGTHTTRSAFISIENTTNRGGGAVWPLDKIIALRELTNQHGMRLHMDGARLLNAVTASDIPATVYASLVDTVWLDLSKGLGAPVGAVLAGDRAFIERARLLKHMYGGAMRQAGIIAAGGVYALQHNVARLAEDHANAKLFAAGVKTIPGVELVHDSVDTNIVFFNIKATGLTPAGLERGINKLGVRFGANYEFGEVVRAVTHLDVNRADIETAVAAVREVVLNQGKPAA